MPPRKPKRQRETQQSFVSTHPKANRCRDCGAVVLACYVRGVMTRVEPMHVNLVGEAVAVLAGLRTYEISRVGDGKMSRRNAGMIREGLPRWGWIHPEHRCGMDWAPEGYRDSRTVAVPVVYNGASPPF